MSTYPLGGAFGGSDFSPMDKSEFEIRSFARRYITELSHYIGRYHKNTNINTYTNKNTYNNTNVYNGYIIFKTY